MAINSIIAEIDAEIARLTQARRLLAGATGAAKFTNHAKSGNAAGKRKRVLSADARKRIADAQRRRWAAQRAKSKKD